MELETGTAIVGLYHGCSHFFVGTFHEVLTSHIGNAQRSIGYDDRNVGLNGCMIGLIASF